ncbi:ACBP-domain-containing protein [Cylindrobasidium torrendii FP15055 ss-10]|uniref:ACBP-domain-containing protein n=1 Tax=Cylindrobasidium torrendii FP15055 ss-10 TaxID=1314674 RepID=A0A0D7BR94_9AGAR|nr:ACBP-domain-containing protein [Cylindrobasidium torrendii FP15055 ss-10]
MSSQELIDAQFNRAVEIVQGLPKTGPIQTDYEEKLTMYSLYKQATSGNVKSARPGIWDMLGRAKWDAWAKHKDLNSFEAKWLYVETLMKVLRKYSDKTMAKTLVQELESFGGDPYNLVMSGTLTRSGDSSDSGSSTSDEEERSPYIMRSHVSQLPPDPESDDEDSGEDEAGELPPTMRSEADIPPNRPGSSLSAARYRTPMTGSLAMSPGPSHVPQSQPLPGFSTPSAFGDTRSPSALSRPDTVGGTTTPPANLYPLHAQFRAPQQPIMSQFGPYVPVRPATRPTLERAVENVQSQLAAVTERLETLEDIVSPHTPGSHSPRPTGWPRRPREEWDAEDLGLWSLFLNPLHRALAWFKILMRFLLNSSSEGRSPSAIVLRRLFLDVSFIVSGLWLFRTLWKRSGGRRRDVNDALRLLWRALLGTKERSLVERGV